MAMALSLHPCAPVFLTRPKISALKIRASLPPLKMPRITLPKFVMERTTSHLIDAGGKDFDHQQMRARVDGFASWLRSLGVKKGDLIILVMRNSVDVVALMLSILEIGAAVTTANPDYSDSAISTQASISKSTLAIVSSSADLQRNFSVPTVMIPEAECHLSSLLAASEFVEDDVDDSQLALLPFSSGTSGLPKGVMLSHRNVVSSLSQLVDGEIRHYALCPEDTVLCMLPMFHIFGLCMALCTLRAGANMVVHQGFQSISRLRNAIKEHRVSVLPIAPGIAKLILERLSADDLASVRFMFTGGSTLPLSTINALKAKFGNIVIGQHYGCTELSGPVSVPLTFSSAPVPFSSNPGSCGTLLRNLRVKIIEDEIYLKGPSRMMGYLGGPAIGEDDWYATGDVGYIDEATNEIVITDRAKDVFKVRGFQVSPSEIEAIILEHPAVEEAAVIGMSDRSGSDSKAVAFVVPRKGENLVADEIKQLVAARVKVPYKFVNEVHIISDMPKTSSGKILRRELPSILAG